MVPADLLPARSVTLRRWQLAWVDELDAAIRESLPELQPFMPWASDAHDLADSRAYVERTLGEWDAGEAWNYAMVASDGAVVGSCGLMTRMGPGVLEIGYWVHSRRTGRGHASDAADALARTGLRVTGIERVVIKHDLANPASGRVAARAGFTEVGHQPAERLAPGQSGTMVVWERRDAARGSGAATPP